MYSNFVKFSLQFQLKNFPWPHSSRLIPPMPVGIGLTIQIRLIKAYCSWVIQVDCFATSYKSLFDVCTCCRSNKNILMLCIIEKYWVWLISLCLHQIFSTIKFTHPVFFTLRKFYRSMLSVLSLQHNLNYTSKYTGKFDGWNCSIKTWMGLY